MSTCIVHLLSYVTLVGYGAQIQRLRQASAKAREELKISCEVIDLRTLQPWDVDTVANVRTNVKMLRELYGHCNRDTLYAVYWV